MRIIRHSLFFCYQLFKSCYQSGNVALISIMVVLDPPELCGGSVYLSNYLRYLVRQLALSMLRFVGGMFHMLIPVKTSSCLHY